MTKTPISLQDLRRRIYVKAKAEPSWRFWGLYVHVCKMETLREAYQMAKANNGAPGIDGVTFEAIEASGVESFLEQIQDELVTSTYRPMRVRQKEIPKDGGRKSAFSRFQLSVTVWSREPSSSSWNPSLKRISNRGRMAIARNGQRMRRSRAWPRRLWRSKTRVIDVDLQAYFDNVRHHLLLEKVAQRVNDADVLHVLKLMLKASGKREFRKAG